MQYIRGGHIDAHRDPHLLGSANAVEEGRTLEHVREEGHGVEGAPPTTGYMLLAEDNLPGGEAATVEIEAGDLIVTSNIIPHRSLPNLSDGVRLSVDWRWQVRFFCFTVAHCFVPVLSLFCHGFVNVLSGHASPARLGERIRQHRRARHCGRMLAGLEARELRVVGNAWTGRCGDAIPPVDVGLMTMAASTGTEQPTTTIKR